MKPRTLAEFFQERRKPSSPPSRPKPIQGAYTLRVPFREAGEDGSRDGERFAEIRAAIEEYGAVVRLDGDAFVIDFYNAIDMSIVSITRDF